ncbi:MAG: alpha/beta hydrolase [Bacteroidaceae bacterium]|nr:alpha/beta hydrolase [Bacteroidaceae bacterium]
MKKFLIFSLSLLLILLGLIGFAGHYMVNYSLSPENRGKDIEGSYTYMFKEYPYLKPYVDSLHQVGVLRDTFINAHDGVRLHAYYVKSPTPTRQTAIIIHGYTDNAIRMMMIGYMYNKSLGFNILLPDLRYSGLSEGNYLQMGWNDRKDVAQWISTAPTLFGDSLEIVVHGISMGGATTMMLAGDPQPESVKCFIEDCGYTSVWDEFKGELKQQFNLPAFPILYASNLMCKLRYGWSFKEANALKQVAKCHLPMLFIHGQNDTFVPTDMVYSLYEAKPQPKDLWLVPSEGHARSFHNFPNEYTERVKDFIKKSNE